MIALLVALVMVVLAAGGAAYYFSRPQTISLNGLELSQDEERLVQSLPEVEINTEDEADVIRAFYLDCVEDSYDKGSFVSSLTAQSPLFARLRVSLGSQPDFDNPGQVVETYDSAPEALVLIANQFKIDPRVIATLIEIESGGLSTPYNDIGFPLAYPQIEGASVDFQVQVGVAAEYIAQQKTQLSENPFVLQQKILTAQAVLNYLAGKQYQLDQIKAFMDASSPRSFVRVFEANFGVDPRVCRD